jgi:hypothetical protein
MDVPIKGTARFLAWQCLQVTNHLQKARFSGPESGVDYLFARRGAAQPERTGTGNLRVTDAV